MTSTTAALARGNIWAITHRCYEAQTNFKHSVERRRYLYWLFQARRRFGLSILNFSVHPNAVHLLLMDKQRGEIPVSLQSIAEHMESDFNRRKRLSTPFWEARYQASIVRPDEQLAQRLTAMDIKVVQAGFVSHPLSWRESGYYETLYPPRRARRVDFTALQRVLNPSDMAHMQQLRRLWVSRALYDCAHPAIDDRGCNPWRGQVRTPTMTLERSYRLAKGVLLPATPSVSKLVP